MKFPGLSVQDSSGLVHQEDKFTWKPKKAVIFQSIRKVPERPGPTGVPQWDLWEGCKNCQTETGVKRRGWERPSIEDQLNDPTVAVREQGALVLSVCAFLQVNLTELKAFPNPPNAVTNVTAAVMVLLAPRGRVPKDRSWKAAKVFMGKVSAWQRENSDDFCVQFCGYT